LNEKEQKRLALTKSPSLVSVIRETPQTSPDLVRSNKTPWYRIDKHINNLAQATTDTLSESFSIAKDLALETKHKIVLALRIVY